MPASAPNRPRSRLPLLPLGLALLAACAQQPAAKTAGPTSSPAVEKEPAASASPAATPPPASPAGTEPQPVAATPEPTWLVDDEGREYSVEKIEKSPARYQFISEDRVMLLGAPVDIVGHDEQWFYVKVYKIDTSIQRPRGRRPEPTPEELAEVAATYEFDTRTADRLRFASISEGLPKTGQWRNGFTIADINADGHPDIVHGPPRKAGGAPVVFLGDGAGSWQVWRDVRIPRAYDYGDAEVADFNADGHADLALGIHLRGVRALLGDGRGNFREWSQGLDYEIPGQGGSGGGFSSRALAIADWNADGRPDIVALGEGPRPAVQTSEERGQRAKVGGPLLESDGVVVFLNQGDGSWEKQEQRDEDMEIFGDSVVVADFDDDGRPDFATGSGIMGRSDLVCLGADGGGWTPVAMNLRRGGYTRAVAAADFDGNGRADLAVAYLAYELGVWRTGIDVHYSQPDGSWRRRVLTAREGREALYALDQGDLDGDGAIDLVAGDSEGRLEVYLGDGKGFFVAEDSPEAQQPVGHCRAYHVELADLDGDHRDEAVLSFADEADALFEPDRCRNGGGLAAWKAAPAGDGGR